jgi:outer membrane protein assembly factor BamB
VWSRDIAADAGAKVPDWGFASSPLIAHGIVTVFAAGPDKAVIGYDAGNGELVWAGGDGARSYCSLHPARIGDVEQLVLTTEEGLIAFEPKKGDVLWRHAWPIGNMWRAMQPVQVGDADFLLGTAFGNGTRRVHVSSAGGVWSTSEVWTSKNIRPYFNDLVVHKDHLFGFDNNFLTCVRLKDGKSTWRERGYGNGQVLLLADQDLLLVLSEQGEVALVEAKPDAHNELARFQAIEGKTWNHPVLAHGKLFVRNGVEAACYELKVE